MRHSLALLSMLAASFGPHAIARPECMPEGNKPLPIFLGRGLIQFGTKDYGKPHPKYHDASDRIRDRRAAKKSLRRMRAKEAGRI